MDIFEPYKITILVFGLAGLLLLIQILIADFTAIKQKHTAGYPLKPDHNNFLFRASRVPANTNESIAVFILFAFFAILSAANPIYLNTFSVVYFLSRLAHMCCYYANLKLVRSISFGLSLVGLIGVFVVGLTTWL